jgi:hypothetical protein
LKFRNKKIVGFWLLMLFLVDALMGLSTNKADSFATADHQRDPVVILASDADSIEIEIEEEEYDDDEWEA